MGVETTEGLTFTLVTYYKKMPNPTSETFDKILSFDPLDAAERLTGSSYKESPGTASLGMAMAQEHNRLKSRALSDANDTFFGITFDDYLGVLGSLGFKELLSGAVPGTEDKWAVHWRDGVLVFSDSYGGGKSLNGGKAYFNYSPKNSESAYLPGFSGCAVLDDNERAVWAGDIDVREGLRHRLTTMEQNGQLLKGWLKQPFLWLLHYQDTKTPGYSYEDINKQRVEQLPIEVQKAIQGRLP
jgi:hypothetical protein